MHIKTLWPVCFSPTGTGKSVIREICRGITGHPEEILDITLPAARQQGLTTQANDLLVVGVPVYMGRVPALLGPWYKNLKARQTPAVCVVVYGNRAYENALLELKDILTEQGCRPVAGAAFIGEHSFSHPDLPTAQGRPDTGDQSLARSFGRAVREKLTAVSSADQIPIADIPGHRPYGGITELWSVDFLEVSEACTQCGTCAEGCPVGAIDKRDSRNINIEECITCCACIKTCPSHARTMKAGPVKDAAVRLNTLYQERQEPAFFLGREASSLRL